MSKQLLTYILLFSLIGCKNGGISDQKRNDTAPLKDNSAPTEIKNRDKEYWDNEKGVTDIHFSDLSVSLEGLIFWSDDIKGKVESDSINIEAEIGETIEGRDILITSSTLSDLTVEVRYETSISLSEEGPHCDLVDWKHYISDWKKIEQKNSTSFIYPIYNKSEAEKFPSVDIEEIKQIIREYCGEEGFALVQNLKNVNEPPLFIGISKHILRITGTNKQTNKRVSKLIMIGIPMGC